MFCKFNALSGSLVKFAPIYRWVGGLKESVRGGRGEKEEDIGVGEAGNTFEFYFVNSKSLRRTFTVFEPSATNVISGNECPENHHDVAFYRFIFFRNFRQQPIFGDFMNPDLIYEDMIEFPPLKKFMEEMLVDYNATPGVVRMDLVLFKVK